MRLLRLVCLILAVCAAGLLSAGCVTETRIIERRTGNETALSPRAVEIEGECAVIPLQIPTNANPWLQNPPQVDVLINGHGPYRFMVDTGHSSSVISAALAQQLALPESASNNISYAGERPQPAIQIRELRIGKAVFRDYMVARHTFEPGLLVVDGILGLNTFKDCQLQLDLPGREMRLLTARVSAPPDGLTCFALEQPLCPIIQVAFCDDQKVRRAWLFAVDTGYDGSFSLPDNVPEQPFKVLREWPTDNVNIGSTWRGAALHVQAEAQLGGYRVGPVVLTMRRPPAADGAGVGLLGMSILQNFVLTLDLRTKTMAITPSENHPLAATQPSGDGTTRP